MKKIYSLITLCLLAAACQQQFVPGSPTDGQPSNIGKTVFYSADDEPLTFLPSVDSSAWTALRSLDERFDACSVPDDLLRRMTTDALVGSAVNYPLNYLIYVYNDPMSAVELIFENSPLHRELAARNDAPAELVQLFSEASMKIGQETLLTNETKQLSYTDEIFLEYLISHDNFSKKLDTETTSILREAVDAKARDRLANPDIYSISSIEPLMTMDRSALLSVFVKGTKSGEFVRYTTVYTPLGKEIEGIISNDYTEAESTYITAQFSTQYPEATILGSASASYNCHSYAWHDNSTNNSVWINRCSQNNEFQLDKYWTLDAFVPVSEGAANRVYYANDDHSAIRLTNGKYVSKWGSGPLMEHDKNYSPYEYSNLQFFNVRSDIVYTLTITGDTPVGLNETNHFYEVASASKLDLEYEWVVKYMDADEPKPFDLIPNGNYGSNYCYRLVCKDYGLFKIHVWGKYMRQTVAYGQLNVIAIPNP